MQKTSRTTLRASLLGVSLSLLVGLTAHAQTSTQTPSDLQSSSATAAIDERMQAWNEKRSRTGPERRTKGSIGSSVGHFRQQASEDAAAKHAAADGVFADDEMAKDLAKGAVVPMDGCEWSPDFAFGSLDGPVWAQTDFDDGTGDALYVGGEFATAGGLPVFGIAKWDGTSWSALGLGMDDFVYALAVFDDGTGEALYVGGDFTIAGGVAAPYIAKWDGTTWSAVGTGMNDSVFALTTFDDGGGDALFAGGYFDMAGGVAADYIAEWNGMTWSALGLGMDDAVETLTVFDDGLGGGPALYAGGYFTFAGGAPADYVAQWDGMAWAPLGLGVDDAVYALTVFDDGTGDALYAGGFFTSAGGAPADYVAQWDGMAWAPLGLGTDDPVFGLGVFDDGTGDALYAGGPFTGAGMGPAAGVARWDGASWSALGMGVSVGPPPAVFSFAAFDDGGGERLFAGGEFLQAGDVAGSFLAAWDATDWAAVADPVDQGVDDVVYAMALFDDGSGPALYAGGEFFSAGGVPVRGIAKWDGTGWSPLGGGVDCIAGMMGMATTPKGVFPPPMPTCSSPSVEALAVFDDGTGPALFVGGSFDVVGGLPASNIAKWDGTSWTPVPLGTDALVEALAVFDDGMGEKLYVGGEFDFAGPLLSPYIASWDGTTWSDLGLGVNLDVETLAVFNDGGGPDLYAGGEFDEAGGAPAMYVARWDGTTWSALGAGMDDEVETLYVYDDGGGADLYAGGQFTTAGGVLAPSIARWDGTAWSALGAGMASLAPFRTVDALVAYDSGVGSTELYAGGFFDFAGGMPAANIARWDGTTWSPVGLGTNEEVEAMEVFDDGGGPALYAGGFFYMAGGFASDYIGRWQCPLLDFGDAPDPSYPTLLASDGARHTIVPGFHLGSAADAELDGLPDAGATGDDVDGTDDEDGVTLAALVQGAMAAVTIEASATGELDAWIDWNSNGDWDDAGEKVFDGENLAAGTNNLSVAVPSGATLGDTFARFRLSTAGVADPTGRAADGEVEDYEVTIEAPAEISIDDVSLAEGNAGTTDFVFTVSRSHNLNALSVDAATSDGTAAAGFDYTALPLQTVSFTAGGTLSQTLTVQVSADTVEEVAVETFFVDLSNPVAVLITDNQGMGSILDDDDSGAPVVTVVDTTTGTGDGMLAECEEARVEVSQLHVTFNQAVRDPAGDTAADDVTNPANYRLFAAGPDRDLSSTACAAPSGDDVALTIASAAYNAASMSATLSLSGGTILADGPYRLLVCDSIVDGAGNALAGGDFARTFRVERRNLFVNGNLDCDLSGWTVTSSDPGEISHAGDDIDAASISGSASVTNLTSSTRFALGQCVAASGGETYDMGGSVRLSASAGVALFLERTCRFFTAASCAGTPSDTLVDVLPLSDTAGAWKSVESELDAPIGSVSMFCGFEVDVPAGEDFSAQLDNLELALSELLFFSADFETGDTSQWR